MRALVQQYTAALSGPCRSPWAWSVICVRTEPVGYDPIDTHEFAKFAVIYHWFDFLIGTAGSLIEHGSEDLLIVCVSGDEFLAVGFMYGDGFLDKDVAAGF